MKLSLLLCGGALAVQWGILLGLGLAGPAALAFVGAGGLVFDAAVMAYFWQRL